MSDRPVSGEHEILDTGKERLLDVKTERELFRELVDAVTEDRRVRDASVYRFDDEDATLRPEATSKEASHPVSPGDHTVWEAFRNDTVAFSRETRTDSDEREPQHQFAVPCGEGSVLAVCVIDETVDTEAIVKAVQSLCTVAGATLSQIRHKQQLRAYEQKLQQRTREIARTEEIMRTYRELVQTAISATSRSDLETAVCDRLVENDGIEFAWISEVDRVDKSISPRAWDGSEQGYLERAPFDPEEVDEPAVRAARDRELAVVENVGDEMSDRMWGSKALERGFRSVIAIPLVHNEILHGVLTVYADQPYAFDGAIEVATDLGSLIGYAMTSLQCRDGLLAHKSTELDIEITAPACFFVRFVRETGTDVSFESMSPTEDGSVLVLVRAEDAQLLVEYARKTVAVESAQLLEGESGDELVKGCFDESFIGWVLSTYGITLESASATPGEVRITVSIPPTMNPREAFEIINAEYPGSKLLAKREQKLQRKRSLTGRSNVFDRLTRRQREIAERAYRNGYFETPKRVTGETIAASMDISTSAFHNHLRTAERELFSWLFEPNSIARE